LLEKHSSLFSFLAVNVLGCVSKKKNDHLLKVAFPNLFEEILSSYKRHSPFGRCTIKYKTEIPV
jgi:hypothetical protein